MQVAVHPHRWTLPRGGRDGVVPDGPDVGGVGADRVSTDIGTTYATVAYSNDRRRELPWESITVIPPSFGRDHEPIVADGQAAAFQPSVGSGALTDRGENPAQVGGKLG
ncbi:hypothetical protein [Frankia sp. AiPa1]|uniref:hypothetical protein n=1 Tax=Frankia sp. AiPa1 TaxID=573492 RepID=UPI00202BA3C6|nr:hypothetical protein [Frankia sp. AiPa1]